MPHVTITGKSLLFLFRKGSKERASIMQKFQLKSFSRAIFKAHDLQYAIDITKLLTLPLVSTQYNPALYRLMLPFVSANYTEIGFHDNFKNIAPAIQRYAYEKAYGHAVTPGIETAIKKGAALTNPLKNTNEENARVCFLKLYRYIQYLPSFMYESSLVIKDQFKEEYMKFLIAGEDYEPTTPITLINTDQIPVSGEELSRRWNRHC